MAGTASSGNVGEVPRGFGHDRIAAVTAREVTLWREHLTGTAVRTLADGRVQAMAPATVNNHLAHLLALFTWTVAHAPSGLLVHGDPTKGVELLPLPAPQPRALTDAQVRTVKNVLDRLDGFHRLKGRRHQGTDARPARHAHARPVRDRAIVAVLFGPGLAECPRPRRTRALHLCRRSTRRRPAHHSLEVNPRRTWQDCISPLRPASPSCPPAQRSAVQHRTGGDDLHAPVAWGSARRERSAPHRLEVPAPSPSRNGEGGAAIGFAGAEAVSAG